MPPAQIYFIIFALVSCWLLGKDPLHEAGKKERFLAGCLILWGIFLIVAFMGFYEAPANKKYGVFKRRLFKNEDVGIAIGEMFLFAGFTKLLRGEMKEQS